MGRVGEQFIAQAAKILNGTIVSPDVHSPWLREGNIAVITNTSLNGKEKMDFGLFIFVLGKTRPSVVWEIYAFQQANQNYQSKRPAVVWEGVPLYFQPEGGDESREAYVTQLKQGDPFGVSNNNGFVIVKDLERGNYSLHLNPYGNFDEVRKEIDKLKGQ